MINTPASQIKDWRENVAFFAHDQFGFTPDKWQKDVFDVFPSQEPDKLRISLQACTGPGKSAVLAICGLNFIGCYGDKKDHPKGACLSITGKNLRDNLWSEYAKFKSRSAYFTKYFTQNDDKIYMNQHPKTWFISARTWDKKANTQEQGRTLSGLHSRYWMIQIDESGDIPPIILKTAEQAMSQENAEFRKIMQAGNPTSLNGLLYVAAKKQRHLWYVVRITGDPDDPNRSPRIDIEWAREQIKLYGRDDPWLKPAILGEFPETSINSLLSVDEVEAAMNRTYHEAQFEFSQKRIGVDVALHGDDKTVLFPRQGLVAFQPTIMRTQRPSDISARLAMAKKRWNCDREYIDNTGGWGSGVVDAYNQSGNSAVPVEFSGSPTDSGFYNKRAEMYWRMAKWVKRGGALPNLPEIVAELAEPTYTHKKGRLIIEPKEKIKERIMRSPDLADALCLTFHDVEGQGKTTMENALERMKLSGGQTKKLKDYDPYAPDRL